MKKTKQDKLVLVKIRKHVDAINLLFNRLSPELMELEMNDMYWHSAYLALDAGLRCAENTKDI